MKMPKFHYILFFLFCFAPSVFTSPAAMAETCEAAVQRLNAALDPKIDEEELISILRSLQSSGNQRLPSRFITKEEARKLGWKPGKDLWEMKALRGKSLGGDVFHNREGKLPDGKRRWREADLDYKGGKRGPKRIVYSNDGLRMITVDHYRTFKEIPPCQ